MCRTRRPCRMRSPCKGWIASTSASACCESLRFAPVRWMASGIPRPSQTRWRLLPSFARSVGLGPVWPPQKPHESNNCPVQLVTNRSDRSGRASPAKRSGSIARCLPLASRADAANRSCQSRSPTLSVTSAKESRFEARTECPSDKPGPIGVVCHRWVCTVASEEAVRSDPIRQREEEH